MINIKEVATKLSEILNSVDNPLRIDNKRVLFLVATQGYRIDSIDNRTSGKNVIPVFVGLAGGENNPVPNLNQTSKSLQIGIYYPIKYKDIFYDLESYLSSVFVGKMINFGALSGSCLTNMGVAEYGDIGQMNLQQFQEWTGNTFQTTFDITSNWFSMSFVLYATSLGSDYMFGNDVKYTLHLTFNQFNITKVNDENNEYARYPSGDTIYSEVSPSVYLYCWKKDNNNIVYTDINPDGILSSKLKYLNGDITLYNSSHEVLRKIKSSEIEKSTPTSTSTVSEELVWSSSGTGASVSPIAQQIIGRDSYSKNVPNITSYNKSLMFYVKPTTNFGSLFLAFYNNQLLNYITNVELDKDYSNGFSYRYNQLSLSINENIELGQPLSFTITLGDKK